MSIPIPVGAQPDLVFYYRVDASNNVTQTPLGRTALLQTRSTPIYAEKELITKIGIFCAENLILDVVDPDVNGLYPTLSPNVYLLQQGYIQIANNVPRKKNPTTGAFSNPPGQYTYGIQVGNTNGNFLNMTGIVTLDATNPTRVVYVYFNRPLVVVAN